MNNNIIVFKDGHTGVQLYRMANVQNPDKVFYPPFTLDYRLGKFFIKQTTNEYASLINSEVPSINGSKPTTFFESIINVTSTERIEFLYAKIAQHLDFYLRIIPL